jgi:tRNA threonylcarbamoyladenosine biosynthesis protein TsaE
MTSSRNFSTDPVMVLFPRVTQSPAETSMLGEEFSAFIAPGDVIALVGPLGSGKTQFSKGLCRGLGVDENRVTSPTFAIAHEYEGNCPVVHMDLYRLESEEEAETIGLFDYFTPDSVVLIEWPRTAARILPEHTRIITFTHVGGDDRRIELVDRNIEPSKKTDR